ncbi:MAG: translation initiation factor IF-2 [Planctomycetes bacterium]|nr:translation initiation factor IF-2 [Planctomycetota bacterium]
MEGDSTEVETSADDTPVPSIQADNSQTEVSDSPEDKSQGDSRDKPSASATNTSGGAESTLLGRITESEDDFVVGRIISQSPGAKGVSKTSLRKKAKRTLEERIDSTSNWNKQVISGYVPPVAKKAKPDTSSSRLHRMKLVYGHEIPKKVRVQSKARLSEKDSTPEISLPITIRDFSETVGIKVTEVITFLMGQGIFLSITDTLDSETAELIISNLKLEVRIVDSSLENTIIDRTAPEKDVDAEARPPVITIMGHVDHGKTTLLDTIRKSRVVDSESGGITQHIGGYQVEWKGNTMTFLDTPGHAAFTAIRARGAQITDIVVLVVAANDGVMPQTEEAVNHANAAGVPVIVAVNKMDLQDAKPDRIKDKLAAMGLIPEEWSGHTNYVPVSALKGDGVENLLEAIHLQAEVMELKANHKKPGRGVVIESRLETGKGVVASVLINEGIVKKGDPILCGEGYGWLRQMEDENGKILNTALPSKIVKLTGLSECPMPGDELNVMPNIREAKAISEERMRNKRETSIQDKQTLTLEGMMEKMGDGKDYNVLLKADVQGSVEACCSALSELGNEEVRAKIVHRGVGGVSESDILLAKTTGARVLAFSVVPDSKARKLAEKEGVEIRTYRIIYEMLQDTQRDLEGLLDTTKVEKLVGEIEVRDVFRISGAGNIAGCYITQGYAERNGPARLIRDEKVVYTGKIQSLRRFKEDVKRVEQRYECGVRLENYEDIRIGDTIQTYVIEEFAQKLG